MMENNHFFSQEHLVQYVISKFLMKTSKERADHQYVASSNRFENVAESNKEIKEDQLCSQ